MYTINHIKIEGFRRLKHIDLPVRPFMVLIGAYGVGKTSLLDAFSLIEYDLRLALHILLPEGQTILREYGFEATAMPKSE